MHQKKNTGTYLLLICMVGTCLFTNSIIQGYTTSVTADYSDPTGDSPRPETDIVSVEVSDYKISVEFDAEVPFENDSGYSVYFLDIDIDLDDSADYFFIADYYYQQDNITFDGNTITWDLVNILINETDPIQFMITSEYSWPPDDYFPDSGFQVTSDYIGETISVEIDFTNNTIVSGNVTINATIESYTDLDTSIITFVAEEEADVVIDVNATIGGNSWVIDTTQFPDGEYTLEILVNNTNGEEVEEVYTVTIQNTVDTTTTIEDDDSEGTTAEESDTTSNTSIGNVTDGFTIIPLLALFVVLSVFKKRF